jgi:iron-sulfur cluster repair protein YtfE (RIC family)
MTTDDVMNSDQSLSDLTPEATISEIIRVNNEAGELLASIGVSLSEHEQETLRSVCQQHKWSEVEVLRWLKKHSSATSGATPNNNTSAVPDKDASLTKWTTYLEESLIRSNQLLLEELDKNFPRIHKIHGNQYPRLKAMKWHFDKFKEALDMYYAFEQEKFFPLIECLKNKGNNNLNHGTIQKLEKSFAVIERDQRRLRKSMNTIREKGNEFENPGNACSTLRIQNENFKILFSQLEKQFEVETDQLLPLTKEKVKEKG